MSSAILNWLKLIIKPGEWFVLDTKDGDGGKHLHAILKTAYPRLNLDAVELNAKLRKEKVFKGSKTDKRGALDVLQVDASVYFQQYAGKRRGAKQLAWLCFGEPAVPHPKFQAKAAGTLNYDKDLVWLKDPFKDLSPPGRARLRTPALAAII